ncbi:MAG: succinyl-diaminopimelate desuccinylase [Myxococcota bacterium]
MITQALPLAQDLIRCRSVTPDDDGALSILAKTLEALDFDCHLLSFRSPGAPEIKNLYARRGKRGRNLCFAGHTDVVPAGEGWSQPPFDAEIHAGRLFGRGAVDMKGAIAAFVAAVARSQTVLTESVSLLITGDEEGPAIDGTQRVLEWLKARGEVLDACLVGEPTNPHRLGEIVKVGRRGSLNGELKTRGIQGHVAYPERAENPIRILLEAIAALEAPLDDGFARFQPSNLELTSIDVGNEATNVIPAEARARFNVRFNPTFSGADLKQELERRVAESGAELHCRVSGEPFLTESNALIEPLRRAISLHTNREPELSTSGGTSDARFIRFACPVVEFGLVGQTMHRVDEHVPLSDLETLTAIYEDFVRNFFSAGKSDRVSEKRDGISG